MCSSAVVQRPSLIQTKGVSVFKNPVTSIIGVLILLCPIVEIFVPEISGMCSRIQLDLAGAGLIASQDGIKSKLAVAFAQKP
jgi:hypothetical protein